MTWKNEEHSNIYVCKFINMSAKICKCNRVYMLCYQCLGM